MVPEMCRYRGKRVSEGSLGLSLGDLRGPFGRLAVMLQLGGGEVLHLGPEKAALCSCQDSQCVGRRVARGEMWRTNQCADVTDGR